MSRHSDRYALSKSIVKVHRAIADAMILFQVMDDLLIESGESPVLHENRAHVNAQFEAIQKHLGEITITLAEDKHGRIRR